MPTSRARSRAISRRPGAPGAIANPPPASCSTTSRTSSRSFAWSPSPSCRPRHRRDPARRASGQARSATVRGRHQRRAAARRGAPLGFDPEGHDADTRVRIAIAWLERAGLVERNENRTFVFQGRPAVASLEEAERKIAGWASPPPRANAGWRSWRRCSIPTRTRSFTADDLARLPAFVRAAEGQNRTADPFPRGIAATPRRKVLRTLYDMAGAGLLRDGPQLSAFVSHKVKNHSGLDPHACGASGAGHAGCLARARPDAETGVWLPLSLRRLNQHLLDQGQPTATPRPCAPCSRA
jgi:hypothetical protein